jgi:hypothetical protein
MKGGKVHGHIRSRMLDDPLCHCIYFTVGVILARNQQVGNLKPDIGFVLQVMQRFQYRLQVPAGDLPVKSFGEGLSVANRHNPLYVNEEYAQVPCYSGLAVSIRRLGTQTRILDVPTHREVIEALKTTITEPEDAVHQIIEKTTDAG